MCAWLIVLVAIFAPLEKFWALHRQKFFRKSFGVDLIYYFLSGLAPRLLLIVPLTLVAAAVHRFEPAGFYSWAAALPLALRMAAALIVGEIGGYWGHRWSHAIPFLWRFHAIHHSAEEMDWLVNSRAHPVDMVFTRFCALVPMYVLGLAQPMSNSLDLVPIIVSIAGTAWGFFIHSNIRLRLGPLEWIVSTPGFHHWHHTNDGPEVINKNFASMLPWVDWCFGTFYLPGRQWPRKYGTDTEVPADFVGQMLSPLSSAPDEQASPVSSN